nr:LysR family transcriptional regulator [Teredinibacter turnerae]
MDQLHLMQVFVAVVDEQGFAAASRQLRLSPPAVTRAIATLESRLGVKLLHRTTRHVRPTDAGVHYYDDAHRILREVELANESAQGVNSEPRGRLSITAPVLFGQKYVLPGVVEYLKRYRHTSVDAVFLDRVVNLLEEGFDVGIRIGELADSSMRARHVGNVSLILVAAPAYLKAEGIPQNPDDLKNHTLISSNSNNFTQNWHFRCEGKNLSLRITPRLQVTTNQAAIDAAAAGLGITRVISYQVADYLADGRLKCILDPFCSQPLPIHIVHREDRLSSHKVRAFIELMQERLRKDKALN